MNHLVRTSMIALMLASLAACQPTYTQRDKTGKGAGIGAAGGAVIGAIVGKGDADKILIGAALGAGLGAGVGAYMDRQEERLAQIPGTQVERVGRDMLLVHFDSDILFATDSASLDSRAQTALHDFSGVLAEFAKTAVVIQGHTDTSGSEAHNQALSERRATMVQSWLIGRGIDPARMTAIGYGESVPIASNETSYGRSANRRVSVLLKAKAR